ncbi:hypothetical protein, partial [Rhizobium sp. L245/93]
DIITAHVLLLPTNHSGMESWQSVHSKGLFPHPARDRLWSRHLVMLSHPDVDVCAAANLPRSENDRWHSQSESATPFSRGSHLATIPVKESKNG